MLVPKSYLIVVLDIIYFVGYHIPGNKENEEIYKYIGGSGRNDKKNFNHVGKWINYLQYIILTFCKQSVLISTSKLYLNTLCFNLFHYNWYLYVRPLSLSYHF